ncbi:MAG: hypothetical protein JNK35_06475 [Phycisphaerae bacterium]|nr:hypothetical protein [Phycisphaerae bacterium]
MELAIKELSYTLAVGFFFFGVIELTFYLLFGRPICQPSVANQFSRVGLIGSVVALVYIVGLSMDVFSKKWVGRTNNPPAMTIPTPGTLLAPEKDLRAAPLFTITRLAAEPTTFGKELIRDRRFSANGGLAGAKIEMAMGMGAASGVAATGVVSPADAKEAASALFYAAKNHVYRYPTHFAELKDVENKIEFVRSVTLCAYVLACTTFALYLVRIGVEWTIRSSLRHHRTPPRWLVGMPKATGAQWVLGAAVPCLMALAIWGGSIAFDSLVFAHASRVYGYYQSTQQLPSPAPSGRGGS